MTPLQRVAACLALVIGSVLASGCTTTIVLMHIHDKLTEGDPAPCRHLNSVDRALQTRCGAFVAGSLLPRDVLASGLPVCPLTLAARDPRLWPVLPELLQKGALPEQCATPPFVALAQTQPCADFASAKPAELQALRWLAQADPRAVTHDAIRTLSCPSARATGLDSVLDGWLAQGLLPTSGLPFSPLAALHPGALGSPLSNALEARGHRAAAAIGVYQGQLAPGFEEALRLGDTAALDWWLDRVPALANQVPAAHSNQLPWRPLVRVLVPSFMPDAGQREDVVRHLLARGADPWKPLLHEPALTVVAHAQQLHSPLLALLTAPPTASALAGQAIAAAPGPGLSMPPR